MKIEGSPAEISDFLLRMQGKQPEVCVMETKLANPVHNKSEILDQGGVDEALELVADMKVR